MTGIRRGGRISNSTAGRRADLDNRYFRSMWEANVCRYFNFLKARGDIRDWAYEPRTFIFHGVTRGQISYTPDFAVVERDGRTVYHEVKGWMDAASRSKLKRMAKFYPQEKVIVIDPKTYRAIAKWQGLIPGWETKQSGVTA